MVDLLPQGFGRQELLRQLDYSENAQQKADWALLNAGASNPIGNLRIKEAHEWLQQHYPNTIRGFSLQEIIDRNETFIESLASFGLFVGGSSGVQGEWPKLLLTLHPDGIARTTRWEQDDQGGAPLWKSVIQQVAEVTSIDSQLLVELLQQQLPFYQKLIALMQDIGIDQEIIENSRYRIENICQQLSELSHG